MNIQELIEYLQTLPVDTKVTCCHDMGDDYYASPTEVGVEDYHLDYTSTNKTLKIGIF